MGFVILMKHEGSTGYVTSFNTKKTGVSGVRKKAKVFEELYEAFKIRTSIVHNYGGAQAEIHATTDESRKIFDRFQKDMTKQITKVVKRLRENYYDSRSQAQGTRRSIGQKQSKAAA
jgi:hypothetical protein